MEEDNISWEEFFEVERLNGINLEFHLAAGEDRRFRIPNTDYLKPRNIDELNELFDKASFEKFY